MQRGQSARNETVCRIPGMTVKAEGQAGSTGFVWSKAQGVRVPGFPWCFDGNSLTIFGQNPGEHDG